MTDPAKGAGAAGKAGVPENELMVITFDEEDMAQPTEEVTLDPRAAETDPAGAASTVARAPTVAISAEQMREQARLRGSTRISRTSIDDGQDLVLDPFNPWLVKEADRHLRRGRLPSEVRHQGADILLLGKRNGWRLWLLLGECVIVLGLLALIVNKCLNMPARALPATQQVELYRKVQAEASQVTAFAEYISQQMEGWSYHNAKSLTDRVLPYMDPEIHGIFEEKFRRQATEAQIYKGRQFYETAAIRYLGVRQETVHKVLVFYRAFMGRGSETAEGGFDLDRVSRRVKILEIGEVEPTATNEWGMRIIKHFDLTEAKYVEMMHENPWDISEGKEDRTKQQEKAKAKADAKAAKEGQ